MRLPVIILSCLALTACASQPSKPSARSADVSLSQRSAEVSAAAASDVYTPAAPACYQTNAGAAALAFDPPVLAGTPRLDLSRDDRTNAAFAGYEDTSTTFYYLRVENRQGDLHGRNGYEHRAISETYGTSYR